MKGFLYVQKLSWQGGESPVASSLTGPQAQAILARKPKEKTMSCKKPDDPKSRP